MTPLAPPRTAPQTAEPAEDHTDDLYFAKPGARGKRKRKAGDPNQMDLFGTGSRVETVEEDTDPSPDAE